MGRNGLFLGQFESLWQHPQFNELHLNGNQYAHVILNGTWQLTENPYQNRSIKQLVDDIQEFSIRQNVRLDPFNPANGGYIRHLNLRWHAVIYPATPEGALISFRRSRFEDLSVDDFKLPPGLQDQLQTKLQQRDPILICGPTYTGKTSFMVALLKKYCFQERIIFLESINEIPHISPYWCQINSTDFDPDYGQALTLEQALAHSLRLSPQRLVVGELRFNELTSFFQASTTGHRASLSTLHAGSLAQIKQRLNDLGCHNFYTQIFAIFLNRNQDQFSISEYGEVLLS